MRLIRASWVVIRHSTRRPQLCVDLPERLRRLIGELERCGLEVGMRPEGFEPLVNRLERLGNRIILGIIAAAFVGGVRQWAGGPDGVLSAGGLAAVGRRRLRRRLCLRGGPGGVSGLEHPPLRSRVGGNIAMEGRACTATSTLHHPSPQRHF